MLRGLFTTIIFLNLVLNISAQSDSTETISWKKGLNFSFVANEYFFTTTPSISFIKGVHYFSAGPQINFDQSRDYNFYGLEFNYRIRPHEEHKRFNFYFFNLTQINVDKYEGTYNVYNSSISGLYSVENKNTGKAIFTYLGYGVDFRFWNRIHINQYLGVGLVGRKYHNIQNVPSNSSLNRNYSGQYIEPSIMLNIGIGFDF